jgi:hypothetical protein
VKRIILAALFLVATMPLAAAKTAGELYADCDNQNPSRINLCSAYLLGVAGVMNIVGHAYGSLPEDKNGPQVILGLCGGNPTGNDLRHVFLAWIDRYPNLRDREAADEATKAFAERWHCR